jgi:paraquat-inducible protein B
MGNMVENGIRAQLKTSNLLTGKSLIALDVFPEAEKTSMKYVDGVPIMPTVPETLAGIMEQVNKIVARIEAMPLEDIGSNVDDTTKNINSLVNSLNAAKGGILGVQAAEAMQELTRAARSIRATAEYLERHPEALVKGKQPD